MCRLTCVLCALVSQWMLKQPRSRSNEDPFFFLITTHILFLTKQRIIHFQVPKSFLCVVFLHSFFCTDRFSPNLSSIFLFTCVQSWCVCLCALPRRIFSHCRLHHIALLPLTALPAVAAEGELYCGKVTWRPSCDPPPPL